MAEHRLIVVADEAQFQSELENAGPKLVVVDFFATWCGPCDTIAPFFAELPSKFPNAVFLKVDVDETEGVASSRNVRAMPTFLFYKNKIKVGSVQGADKEALQAMVEQHYVPADGGQGEVKIKGHLDLNSFLNKSGCECLNDSDDHPFSHVLTQKGGYLESDCDEQLIIYLSYNQAVKLHSLQLYAPIDKGPKTLKIFINRPHALDFDQAEKMEPLQTLILTPDDMKEGSTIGLRFVKYQNVQNVTMFVKDNQQSTETTQIDYLSFIGSPVSTTNMSDFKRIKNVEKTVVSKNGVIMGLGHDNDIGLIEFQDEWQDEETTFPATDDVYYQVKRLTLPADCSVILTDGVITEIQ